MRHREATIKESCLHRAQRLGREQNEGCIKEARKKSPGVHGLGHRGKAKRKKGWTNRWFLGTKGGMEHSRQMESMEPRELRRCVGESRSQGAPAPCKRAGMTPRATAVTTRLQALKLLLESMMESGYRPG